MSYKKHERIILFYTYNALTDNKLILYFRQKLNLLSMDQNLHLSIALQFRYVVAIAFYHTGSIPKTEEVVRKFLLTNHLNTPKQNKKVYKDLRKILNPGSFANSQPTIHSGFRKLREKFESKEAFLRFFQDKQDSNVIYVKNFFIQNVIYKNYNSYLRFGYYFAGNLEDAEDAIAEAATALFELNVDVFWRIEKIDNYFKTMLYRKCIHVARKKSNSRCFELFDVAIEEDILKKLFFRKELAEKIRLTFKKIKKKYATVLKLRFIKGYGHEEIVFEMKLSSLGASRKLLNDAKKAFIKAYEISPPEDPNGIGKKGKDNHKNTEQHVSDKKNGDRSNDPESQHLNHWIEAEDDYQAAGRAMMLFKYGSKSDVEKILDRSKEKIINRINKSLLARGFRANESPPSDSKSRLRNELDELKQGHCKNQKQKISNGNKYKTTPLLCQEVDGFPNGMGTNPSRFLACNHWIRAVDGGHLTMVPRFRLHHHDGLDLRMRTTKKTRILITIFLLNRQSITFQGRIDLTNSCHHTPYRAIDHLMMKETGSQKLYFSPILNTLKKRIKDNTWNLFNQKLRKELTISIKEKYPLNVDYQPNHPQKMKPKITKLKIYESNLIENENPCFKGKNQNNQTKLNQPTPDHNWSYCYISDKEKQRIAKNPTQFHHLVNEKLKEQLYGNGISDYTFLIKEEDQDLPMLFARQMEKLKNASKEPIPKYTLQNSIIDPVQHHVYLLNKP